MSSTRTTDRPPAPGRPRRRTGLWITLGVLVVLLVVAAFIGPRIYASIENEDAAAPLVTAAATPSATASQAATDASLDGAWAIAPGATAGYRVAEVLNGQDVTVTGRTDQVTGGLAVAGGELTEGTVSVDLASVTTDSGRRDDQFRGEDIMDVEQFPTADFALTRPVPLGGLDVGSTIAVQLVGTLTLKGTTRDVTVPATVERTAQDAVTVTGAADVTWSDYGVQAPDLGFVSVEDAGTIEFTFAATPA
ncbi:YceI family protein [Kineococcus sp. SYSU DK003]|uniref:YceI family protein n=1 Tax=Kineococcus sp. SYSU DK003 TaxID=3383124 RepID=UPI003D7D3116